MVFFLFLKLNFSYLLGKEALQKNWLFTVHVPSYCTGKTLQNSVLAFILCASEDGTITEFAPSAKTV